MARHNVKAIMLGTGGYIPTSDRATAAVLLRAGNNAILFDAGTGVGRLLQKNFRRLLDGVRELHIFLSHYHLDHVIGITWLLKVWTRQVHLYLPSSPLVNTNGVDALARLTDAPLFGLPLSRFPFPVSTTLLTEPSSVTVGPLTIGLLQQSHGDVGSVGFRVDDLLAYVTDTNAGLEHVEFLSSVRVALIDAMYDDHEYKQLTSPDHASSRTAASVAAKASVGRLGLIHINPSYDLRRRRGLLREGTSVFEPTFVPSDEDVIKLS